MLRKYFKRFFSKQHKKTGFNGYIYDFSVDYNPTDANNIKDIYKDLMEKNKVV